MDCMDRYHTCCFDARWPTACDEDTAAAGLLQRRMDSLELGVGLLGGILQCPQRRGWSGAGGDDECRIWYCCRRCWSTCSITNRHGNALRARIHGRRGPNHQLEVVGRIILEAICNREQHLVDGDQVRTGDRARGADFEEEAVRGRDQRQLVALAGVVAPIVRFEFGNRVP